LILVDTSIWVDHFRSRNARLSRFLEERQVSTHPCVVGELAVGNLQNRDEILQLLGALPVVQIASHVEALDFIANFSLAGRGLGYIDVHLMASVRLTPETLLWSKDKRLHTIARGLSIPTVSTP